MKKKTLENRQSFTRKLMQLLVLMAMLLAPKGAWAETLGYDLWVGGVQVTSDNYYNVVGDDIGGDWGCVTFDASTNTLTLNGATVTGSTASSGSILSKLDALTIVIKGTCVLNSSDTCTAIRAEGTGSHTLTIKPANPSCSLQFSGNRAIRDFSSVTLTGLAWDGTYTYKNATISGHTGYMLTKVDNEKTVEVGDAQLTYQGDGLFVAGVYVTSSNASDVLGDGTVSFAPAKAAQGDNPATPATLTLNNAEFQGNVIWPNSADLYVVFKGRSTITMDSDNDYFFVKSGNGTTNLYFENSGKNPIPLVINNSFRKTLYDSNAWGSNSVKIDNNSNTNFDWWLNTETGTSYQIALNWIGPDLIVAGVDLTSDNNNVLGDNKVSFTAAAGNEPATLTLNGASITGNIEVNKLSALKIIVIGENTITAGEVSAIKSNLSSGSCALTFSRGNNNSDCSLTLNSTGVTAISTGFSGPTYDAMALVAEGEQVDYRSDYGLSNHVDNDVYNPVTSATITSYTTYDLIINGTTVTNLNREAIITVNGGTISFDGEHTLTLSNIPWYSFNSSYPFIQTSMDLTINLVGTNEPDMGNVLIQRNANDNETHTLTFATDETNPGMFIVRRGTFSHEGFNVVYNNHLAKNASGYFNGAGDDPTDWVAIPKYGLTIAGVEVTEANAGNVFGEELEEGEAPSVSFTPASGQTPDTLKLNNASIILEDEMQESPGIIYEGTNNLTISIVGTDNTIQGGHGCSAIRSYAQTPPTLTFVNGDSNPCSLSLIGGDTPIDGFNVSINNALRTYTVTSVTPAVMISSAVQLTLPSLDGKGTITPEQGTYGTDQTTGALIYGYGQTVNLTYHPTSQDYVLTSFKVINSKTNTEIETTSAKSGDTDVIYTFVMPSDPVTVTTTFVFDISNENYTASIADATYTGVALVPTTVKLKLKDSETENTLTKGVDFNITGYQIKDGNVLGEGELPINAGDYIVTIEGIGNYTGTTTAGYTIAKATISEAQFTKPQGVEKLTYTGAAQQLVTAGSVPTGATIKFYSEYVPDYYDGFNLNCLANTYTYTADIPTGTNAGYYALLYKVDGGTNYKDVEPGQTVIVFVDSVDVKDATIEAIADQTFTGEAIEPELTVTFGQIPMVLGTDYTVAYTDNVSAGEATATITGKGNFKGTKSANFNIVNKTLNITFAENQTWASFYDTTEDFNLPNNVMAYIVTEIGQNSVTVAPINYVPKNVAVLLENNTTMTDVTNTSSAGNLLQGAGANGFAVTNDATVYALYNNKMMRVASGTTIPAGKCYLVVGVVNAGFAPQLNIVFENEGNTTGINASLVNSEEVKGDLYDLQGRKVVYPKKKGLYIQNGRKVVVNNK